MSKKILSLIICFALTIAFASGCGSTAESALEDGEILVYYMDVWGSAFLTEAHKLTEDTVEAQVEEAVSLLASTPETVGYRRTIPEGIEPLDINLDEAILTINFNQEYQELSGYSEVLVRAAIVKTLLQISGINGVIFYVASEPLTDTSGSVVGTMTAETFIEDYGEETESLSATTLVLYFATADGQALVEKSIEIYYNSNIARERLVIENLIKGCDDDDAMSPIPSGTKLISITVTDGICYVNFDSSFVNVDSGIASNVVLYAIVNSLTEIETINKVQILVEGSAVMPTGGFDFELGTSYVRDLSYIYVSEEESESDLDYEDNDDIPEEMLELYRFSG